MTPTGKEREVKFYIQDMEQLAERLNLTGADLIQPRHLERNLRLDTIDGQLKAKGQILRLRQDSQARVTYKANTQNEGGVLYRTEIEFVVDDFEVARKLFAALGYQDAGLYEKYRRVYRLGAVDVMLDELPFGHFVEIEAPANPLIEGVAQMLRLDWTASIDAHYLGLFERIMAQTGHPFADATFANFAGMAFRPADMQVRPADA